MTWEEEHEGERRRSKTMKRRRSRRVVNYLLETLTPEDIRDT